MASTPIAYVRPIHASARGGWTCTATKVSKCRRTASMYGANEDFSVDEQSTIDPQSPYATTKVMVENVLRDVAKANNLRVLSLRYFNPIGADPQLRTGLQAPRPSHALGKLVQAYEDDAEFRITGADWPTRDGTGIRDYVHVWDLARAHVEGLRRFDQIVHDYCVVNLGSGTGTTVRELVEAFQAVVWHLFVTHPALKAAATKWESTAAADTTKKVA